MTKFKLSILFFFVLVFAASAFAIDDSLRSLGQWGMAQGDSHREGLNAAVSANWENISQTISISSTLGTYQPMIADIDGDGSLEVINSLSNSVQVFEVDSNNNFYLGSAFDIGAAQFSPYTVTKRYDSDDYLEFAYGHNTKIGLLQYDGISITTELNATLNATYGSVLGAPVCLNISNIFRCIFTTRDSANIIHLISLFRNNTLGNHLKTEYIGTYDKRIYASKFPVYEDLHNTGHIILIFPCDDDSDGNTGVCAYDSFTNALDTSFSGDGKIDDINGLTSENPVDMKLMSYYTGSGNFNLLLMCEGVFAGTQTGSFNVISSSGSVLATRTFDTSTFQITGSMAVGNFLSNTYYDACLFYNKGTTSSNIKCYSSKNLSVSYFATAAHNILHGLILIGSGAGGSQPLTIADYGLGNYNSIFAGNKIVTLSPSLKTNSLGSYSQLMSIPIDFNQDGTGDVCGAYLNNFVCVRTNATNNPPVLDPARLYSGYYGYYPVVCLGSDTTFRAQECGGSITACNYNNDLAADQERMISNCGKNAAGYPSSDKLTNIETGAFAGSQPEFSCQYNHTGVFHVTIYLEDGANIGDRNAFNPDEIAIQVLNGTDGVTCNINSITTPDSQPSLSTLPPSGTAEQAVQQFANTITAGVGWVKFVFVMIIAIVCMLGTAKTLGRTAPQSGTMNSIISMTVGFCVILVAAIIHLISLFVPALILISFSLIVLFSRVLSPGQG